MQNLPNNVEKLEKEEKKLRQKLYAGKPVKDQLLKRLSCGRSHYQWNSMVRQSQKWKLEAIIHKTRNQQLQKIIYEQRNDLEGERYKRLSAQVATSCLRAKVHELKYVEKANTRIIKQAQQWKQQAESNKTSKTVNQANKQIEDLTKKLTAAQRKLDALKSCQDKLDNAKDEIAELRIELNMRSKIISSNQENQRLDAVLVRQIVQRSTRNFREKMFLKGRLENGREWNQKRKNEIGKLKERIRELAEKGVKTNFEYEKKLEEKEEETRYLEYLHDTIYQAFTQQQKIESASPSNPNQPM